MLHRHGRVVKMSRERRPCSLEEEEEETSRLKLDSARPVPRRTTTPVPGRTGEDRKKKERKKEATTVEASRAYLSKPVAVAYIVHSYRLTHLVGVGKEILADLAAPAMLSSGRWYEGLGGQL